MKPAIRFILNWAWLPVTLLALFEPTLSERYRDRIYMESYLRVLQKHPGTETQIGCVILETHAEYGLVACGNPIGWVGAGNW